MYVQVNGAAIYCYTGGAVYYLGGRNGPWANLMMCARDAEGRAQTSKLGLIDFSRDSSEALIDLGLVDEKVVEVARTPR